MRQFSDGDKLFGPEVTAVFREALAEGTSILSGCSPSAAGGLDVSVASGTAATNGSESSVSSTTVSLAARDSFDRYDLIVYDGTSVTDVTGSVELTCPDLPSQNALIAIVKVPSSSDGSAITVNDSRVLTSSPHFDVVIARTLSPDTLEADDVIAFDELDLPVRSSDPGSPSNGEIWYRSDLD